MAAYALAKYNFRGRNALFLLTLATIMIPLQVILLPVYQVVSDLGTGQHPLGHDHPAGGDADRRVPAAPVHAHASRRAHRGRAASTAPASGGSSRGSSCRCAVPALAVVAIFSVIWRWNDFLWPLIVAQDESVHTLPVALARLNSQLVVPFNLVLAMSVMSILPVIILFLLMQRQIITGIAQTGLK